MTEPETPASSFTPSTGDTASPEALRQQIESLRMLFVAALMALLLLSVGVNIYLFRQVSMVRKELDTANSFLADYHKNKEPLLTSLISGLQGFAQTNADLGPILEKYGIKPGPTNIPSASSPEPASVRNGK